MKILKVENDSIEPLVALELKEQSEGTVPKTVIEESLVVPPSYQDNEEYKNDFDLKELYDTRSPWTPEQKLGAVLAYIITGTSRGVFLHTGIPAGTVRRWKHKAAWWPDAVNQMRKRKQDEVDAKLTGALDRIIDNLVDRVDNGDVVFNKEGLQERKPISGRDMAIIMGVTFDKRALMRGDATSRVEKVTTDETLNKLVHKFTELSNQIEGKTVEGEATIIEDSPNA